MTRSCFSPLRIFRKLGAHFIQSRFSVLHFSFFILFCTPLFSQTRVDSSASLAIVFDSTLAAVRSLFDNGSYTSCELQARRALEEKSISDSLRVQFEKYVAFSLVAQDRNDDAVEHFENALKIDSSLTLDTVMTSPKILAVFERARNQYLADKMKKQVQKKQNANSISPDSVEQFAGVSFGERGGTHPGPSFRTFLFPGWEQIYRGEQNKGYVLLGAGALAAASALTAGFLSSNARSNYLSATTADLASSRYTAYNLYYHMEYYSISAFILVYAYSALDAFVNLPPYFRIDYSPTTLSTQFQFQVQF